ncbi:uncharacterized protein LOC113318145 isoform X2 [Papaver somniferum]|uniref:uncharacterized protein LOC113318145 isoform X2 n=1 Tax=Papaver somniferum TaxID=3469 RepID=UPI000E6FA009|nr:uncharacterized protein LOC113318145 isoform X2 [Papaver somniferum]
MSSSNKYGLASNSPDRPTYPSGQRGVYGAASLNKSGSFREGMENRILSSRPGMSRSGATCSPAEVANFLHSLPLDAKVMVSGQKLPRQAEVSRILSASLGVSQDNTHSGSSTTRIAPEGIKKAKGALHENVARASDQVKVCTEMVSRFDKCFSNLWTRKRSRSDIQPSDRSNTSLAVDRLASGGIAGKLATQSNGISSGFDHEHQKLEEQSKNAVSKRIRSSMADGQMDIRGSVLGRPPAAMDRDKEIFGIASGGQVQSAEKDQALPIGMDGWEKSKMRKKRSGIKSDVSMNGTIRSPDGDRESKRETQQRLGIEARSRFSNVHGFRSGPSNGAVGVGKLDVTSQQTTGLGMRSAARSDQDNGSLVNDRRDRLAGVDKEKINLKAVNKLNFREPSNAASPASTLKINASARGPRSSFGTMPKPIPNVHRAIGGPDDWETPQPMNKLNAVVGTSNRKRSQSARSSSPPVTQWGEQRPQKMSRVARRTNLLPHLPGHDESLAIEKTSDVSGNESGLRHSSGNIVQQVRPKVEPSVALSESEESGAAEVRSKDKGKKAAEMDEKSVQNFQKVTIPGSSRKNKMRDEDFGSTVRRPGRGGRSSAAGRSSVSKAVDKLDNTITAKQLRSARHGSDKIVSKVGRPPNRKMSERKAYTRPRYTMDSGVQDIHGESHDVHEELLAAANAAADPGQACSGTFWRQMEPLFSVISADDINFLKQQVSLGSNPLTPTTGVASRDNFSTIPNRFELVECNGDRGFASQAKHSVPARTDDNVIPLCQRLISALVSEEEIEEFCYTGDDETSFGWDAELKANSLNQQSFGNYCSIGKPVTNGYRIPSSGRYRNGFVHDEVDFPAIPNSASFRDDSVDGLLADQEVMPNAHCSELPYNQMALEERLLLELQSIGIYPDPVPGLADREDEDISEDDRRVEEELNQLVTKKNHLLGKVQKSAAEARELQEREIERQAYDKLVGLVYSKYMACFGPNASSGKGASGKIAKQAALASVKRTLEQCQKFENFGESCFNEPVFQDLFRSRSSNLKVSECVDSIIEGESANLYTGTRSSEVRVSGTHHIAPFIPQSGQNMDTIDKYHLSDETTVKEDKGCTKIKQRELLLDEVVGGTGISLRDHSGTGSSLATKGKRTGPAKIGRPALGTVKGERKPKSKPKQKTVQLSASVEGLLGKGLGPPKAVFTPASRYSGNATDINAKKENGLSMCTPDEEEALDLSHLPLSGIDDDLDGQGQDFDSIFKNIDDEALQDIDFMGLEIPMDDLSDLNMMV